MKDEGEPWSAIVAKMVGQFAAWGGAGLAFTPDFVLSFIFQTTKPIPAKLYFIGMASLAIGLTLILLGHVVTRLGACVEELRAIRSATKRGPI